MLKPNVMGERIIWSESYEWKRVGCGGWSELLGEGMTCQVGPQSEGIMVAGRVVLFSPSPHTLPPSSPPPIPAPKPRTSRMLSLLLYFTWVR